METQRHLFDIPDHIHYLNCAYMAPLMHSVLEKGNSGVARKAQPWEIGKEAFFEAPKQLRKAFAKLIGASEPEQIAIIPSVSYGMANAARNIPISKGEEILVLQEQFPSNYYPWEKLARESGAELLVVGPDPTRHKQSSWNERILDAIQEKTKIIALSNVHWADGTLFDLKAIGKAAKQVGAKLIVDGTQSVGAYPIDVEALEIDVLICAGYKWLLGPYSIGLAYYHKDFNNGNPIEDNWIAKENSEDFAGLVHYKTNFEPGAQRYDVGERSNFILVPMMLAALQELNRIGIFNIQAYCNRVTHTSLQQLRSAGLIHNNAEQMSPHLFGIDMPKGFDFKALTAQLEKEQYYVSIRGQSVRVSVNIFNTEEEVKALTEKVLKLV